MCPTESVFNACTYWRLAGLHCRHTFKEEEQGNCMEWKECWSNSWCREDFFWWCAICYHWKAGAGMLLWNCSETHKQCRHEHSMIIWILSRCFHTFLQLSYMLYENWKKIKAPVHLIMLTVNIMPIPISYMLMSAIIVWNKLLFIFLCKSTSTCTQLTH